MLTLNDGRSELWQWDTGRKLTVDAECSQVHFSNKVFGRSIDVDVVGGLAIIPDILLQTDKELMAWAFVGTQENGYTKIGKVFKVNKRNKPADYVFTPTEQTTLEEILKRIKDLEENPDVDVDLTGYVKSVNGQTPDENGNVKIDIPNPVQGAGIWTNKRLVAFGTSITWACQNYNGGYLEIVKNRNGFAAVANMGVSGAAMPTICTKIKQTDISSYDLVLLECATNDFKLNVPLGTVGLMGDSAFDTSTFCGAVRDSIEHILTNKQTMHILLITDTQRDNSGYDVNFTNTAGHKLIEYVDALLDIGALYGLPVCDWYRESGFNAFTLPTYTKDGLHPNDAGYAVLGNLTASAVGNMYCGFDGSSSDVGPDATPTTATFIKGSSTSEIWEDGKVLSLVENPSDLDIVAGYTLKGATGIYGPIAAQENRATSISNALCGYFAGKTVSLSSFTLSNGKQIKFALQLIALNDDGTFEWVKASDFGWVNCSEWLSEPAPIQGAYDTTKRHLLFIAFMADTLTQDDCEEIKTLIRIA